MLPAIQWSVGVVAVAALIASGFEPSLYLAPASAATFFFAALPGRGPLRQCLLGALGTASVISLGYHQWRRHPPLAVPLKNELALVTGASSGIGWEISKELAKRDINLVLVARRESKLKELADEIRSGRKGKGSSTPLDIHIYKADLSKPEEAERLYERICKDNLSVTMLINNAGLGHAQDFHSSPFEKIEELINVNCLALTKLTRLFGANMAKKGRGRIMSVSSIAGSAPGPRVATYSATKAYVTSFTLALQHELEPKGVSVTCLIPGATFTEFQKESNSNEAWVFRIPGLAMSASSVAKAGVNGMLKGRSQVVPGMVNQCYLLGVQWLPPKLLRRVTEFAWSSTLM